MNMFMYVLVFATLRYGEPSTFEIYSFPTKEKCIEIGEKEVSLGLPAFVDPHFSCFKISKLDQKK